MTSSFNFSSNFLDQELTDFKNSIRLTTPEESLNTNNVDQGYFDIYDFGNDQIN